MMFTTTLGEPAASIRKQHVASMLSATNLVGEPATIDAKNVPGAGGAFCAEKMPSLAMVDR